MRHLLSCGSKNPSHRRGNGAPSFFVCFELAAPLGSEFVESCTASCFRHPPLSLEKACLRHPMQSRVERTCLHAENLVRRLLDIRRNCKSVVSFRRGVFQKDQFKGSLKVFTFSLEV